MKKMKQMMGMEAPAADGKSSRYESLSYLLLL